jgi:hypothetical protein
MRLSFQSRLAISYSLCCTLRAARRLFAAALFRLKITSSGRGTFPSTWCAHFDYKRKEWVNQQSSEDLEKTNARPKKPSFTKNLS